MRVNFCNFHSVQCGKMKNLVSPKNISSNQLFSNLFSKNVAFTKFLSKKCDFHIVAQYTVWKNEKFTLTAKIIRQIISLVISLVKTLLSRNFCQKCVRVNFSVFHTLRVWKIEVFDKNFVKATFLLKKLLKSSFHEIFFQ